MCPEGAGERGGMCPARGAERRSSWQYEDGIKHSQQLVNCVMLG